MLYSLLIFLYGISWTIVYISFIHNGRKEKVYCMPFFCIMNEIVFDGLYTTKMLNVDISIQTFFFGFYGICALIFLFQFFKYKKDSFPSIIDHKYVVPYIAISSLSALAIQLAFYHMWSYPSNLINTSYIHTFAISFLLLIMLWIRGTKGYDLRIAIFKLLGNVCATILSSNIYMGENIDIAVVCLGSAMFIADVAFLISFLKMRKEVIKS